MSQFYKSMNVLVKTMLKFQNSFLLHASCQSFRGSVFHSCSHRYLSKTCHTELVLFHIPALKQYSTNAHFEKTLDELEEYAERQLFFAKPPVQEEKPVTSTNLLQDCKNVEDVLKLFSSMQNSNQLANEDVVLYLEAISKLLRVQHQLTAVDSAKEKLPAVLNDIVFHELIRKTLFACIYFPTGELLAILICFAKLKLPVDSNAVKIIIRHIQRRINDLFPKDVAMCMYAFHIFKLKSQEMEDLEQGLIFHLDNMAIDEVFFIATLENSGLPALLDLVQKFAKRVRVPTRTCLWKALLHVVRELSKNDALTDRNAVKILRTLAILKKRNDYLISVAMERLRDSEPAEYMLEQAARYLAWFDLSLEDDPKTFPSLRNCTLRTSRLMEE